MYVLKGYHLRHLYALFGFHYYSCRWSAHSFCCRTWAISFICRKWICKMWAEIYSSTLDEYSSTTPTSSFHHVHVGVLRLRTNGFPSVASFDDCVSAHAWPVLCIVYCPQWRLGRNPKEAYIFLYSYFKVYIIVFMCAHPSIRREAWWAF